MESRGQELMRSHRGPLPGVIMAIALATAGCSASTSTSKPASTLATTSTSTTSAVGTSTTTSAPAGLALKKITAAALSGVSCPSTTWCMAVDGKGNAITYSGGAWLAPHLIDPGSPATADAGAGSITGISCPTTTWCLATSYLDGFSLYDGTSWTPFVFAPSGPGLPGGESDLNGVSCSGPTFCSVTSAHGTVVFYDGGTWSEPGTNNSLLQGAQSSTPVSCTVMSCMYTDNSGNSQTSNSQQLSPLTAIPGQTNQLASSVSCTSTTFCVAVNTGAHSAASWNGSAWTQSAAFSPVKGLGLNGVSCTGPTFCVALDDSDMFRTTDGLSWSAPGRLVAAARTATLVAVSCAASTFCAAVDSAGYAYTFNPSQL